MARQAYRPFEQLKLTKDGFLELYSVDGPLGEGAFGAVMRGTDKRSGEGIHVVRIGDALHVKQVQASAPGRITLISANESYAPIELDRDEVEVIGRVVWKGGRV